MGNSSATVTPATAAAMATAMTTAMVTTATTAMATTATATTTSVLGGDSDDRDSNSGGHRQQSFQPLSVTDVVSVRNCWQYMPIPCAPPVNAICIINLLHHCQCFCLRSCPLHHFAGVIAIVTPALSHAMGSIPIVLSPSSHSVITWLCGSYCH